MTRNNGNSLVTDVVVVVVFVFAVIAACVACHQSGYWKGHKSGYELGHQHGRHEECKEPKDRDIGKVHFLDKALKMVRGMKSKDA